MLSIVIWFGGLNFQQLWEVSITIHTSQGAGTEILTFRQNTSVSLKELRCGLEFKTIAGVFIPQLDILPP